MENSLKLKKISLMVSAAAVVLIIATLISKYIFWMDNELLDSLPALIVIIDLLVTAYLERRAAVYERDELREQLRRAYEEIAALKRERDG